MHRGRQKCRIGIVLMAAGKSERFGQNKLLADFGGRPLAGCAMQMMNGLAEQLREREEDRHISADLIAVTRWPAVEELCREYDIPCAVYEGGEQSDTIRTALELPAAAGWDACVFLTGDQPFLQAESVRKMLEAFAEDPGNVYRLAWKERPGNPVLFPAAYFEGLRKLQGREGGRTLLKQEQIPVIPVQAGSERELFDVDTEEDLKWVLHCSCEGTEQIRNLKAREDTMNQAVSTKKAPAAIGPYSQGVRAGNTIYVSGQLPIDPATGEFAGEDIRTQTKQSLTNIREILAAAGADMSAVVKTTVLLQDIADFAAMNEVYAEFFSEPYPARAAFQVAAVPKGALVEIEAVAVIGD